MHTINEADRAELARLESTYGLRPPPPESTLVLIDLVGQARAELTPGQRDALVEMFLIARCNGCSGVDGPETYHPIGVHTLACCGIDLHGDLCPTCRPEPAFLREGERPTVVCLCGSTRFYAHFQLANYEETMRGNIVLSVGFYPHSQVLAHGETLGCTAAQKEALDHLHLRKIDMADEILVINLGGYIGESTAREIAYATAAGKRIRYLE
jgi:hypothetical protein